MHNNETNDKKMLIDFLKLTKERFHLLIDKENGDLKIIISDDMRPLLPIYVRSYNDVEKNIDRCLEIISSIPNELLVQHGFTDNHLILKLIQIDICWLNVVILRKDPLRNFNKIYNDEKEMSKEEKDNWVNYRDNLRKNWYRFLNATDNCVFESLNNLINTLPNASGIFGVVKGWKNSVEIAIEEN
ncbi:MAG: hypothetical protein R3321_10645 [Nitrososphaeraceae archaeon]|nr:hypothetical protein [Nitrososphaeraceae archaeon]